MSAKNSFDVVSKIDLQEVVNAIQQAIKEVRTRFDFKGSASNIELEKNEMILVSDDEYRMKALIDILQQKLVKRGVPLNGLTYGRLEDAAGGKVRQKISLQQGIPTEKAKEIVKVIKDSKFKVQAAIMGDYVRISGSSRDILQQVIHLLRSKDFGIHMDFTNYRGQ
ncbi:MAG: YajQ family cyclic di-GMP-binding protein [Acidobacteria bacterium]|nr:YajQ family cyclic di-GMP-binding protein [Acidobacteriota bacterium]